MFVWSQVFGKLSRNGLKRGEMIRLMSMLPKYETGWGLYIDLGDEDL